MLYILCQPWQPIIDLPIIARVRKSRWKNVTTGCLILQLFTMPPSPPRPDDPKPGQESDIWTCFNMLKTCMNTFKTVHYLQQVGHQSQHCCPKIPLGPPFQSPNISLLYHLLICKINRSVSNAITKIDPSSLISHTWISHWSTRCSIQALEIFHRCSLPLYIRNIILESVFVCNKCIPKQTVAATSSNIRSTDTSWCFTGGQRTISP